MISPRLLTLKEARQYLGGVSPRQFAKPRYTSRGVRYDRLELDAALDAQRGLGPRSAGDDDPDQALADWEARHGAPAGRP